MLSVVDLNSPAHLFGLAERTVAVESLYVKALLCSLLYVKSFFNGVSCILWLCYVLFCRLGLCYAFRYVMALLYSFCVMQLCCALLYVMALLCSLLFHMVCGVSGYIHEQEIRWRVFAMFCQLSILWPNFYDLWPVFRVFLAEQLEMLEGHLESLIPSNKKAFLQTFYSQVRAS